LVVFNEHLRIEAGIAEELSRTGVEDAATLARTITASAHGISQRIQEPDLMRAAIELVCRCLIKSQSYDN
jgi:hypothetical protein